MKIAFIHITSANCYFEAHPIELVQPYLRPSIEEVVSFPKSHGLTLSFKNSLGAGLAAAMVDVCYLKRHVVQKIKMSIRGRFFEEAQLLRIPSFVDAPRIYVVEQEQSFHNH